MLQGCSARESAPPSDVLLARRLMETGVPPGSHQADRIGSISNVTPVTEVSDSATLVNGWFLRSRSLFSWRAWTIFSAGVGSGSFFGAGSCASAGRTRTAKVQHVKTRRIIAYLL